MSATSFVKIFIYVYIHSAMWHVLAYERRLNKYGELQQSMSLGTPVLIALIYPLFHGLDDFQNNELKDNVILVNEQFCLTLYNIKYACSIPV